MTTTHHTCDVQPSQALLAFPVADEWFALPLDSVRAVLTADVLRTISAGVDNLARLAEASPRQAGWLELHGQEVLVLDMTQTLVPGADSAAPQQIILLQVGHSLTGLITTGTSETITVAAGQVQQPSDSAGSAGWTLGLCRADGRTITVLDPRMFVGSLCPAS